VASWSMPSISNPQADPGLGNWALATSTQVNITKHTIAAQLNRLSIGCIVPLDTIRFLEASRAARARVVLGQRSVRQTMTGTADACSPFFQ
jgi:hypothetical protein